MRKREIDPNSRDYEFSEIEPDERFVQTAKEFWVTIGILCLYGSDDPESLHGKRT